MGKKSNKKAKTSIVIPAYNEEKSIATIIKTASKSSFVDEIIVVDDGSQDNTYNNSLCCEARVIKLDKNRGKTFAMDAGVKEARNNIITFLDADLIGLNKKHIKQLLTPLIKDTADMNIGIRKRKSYIVNKLIRVFPLIGGERSLKKDLWNSLPREYINNFEIEIAMNYFAKKNKFRTKSFYMPGVNQLIKEKKHGFLIGALERLKMIKDILSISFKLYVLDKFFTINHYSPKIEIKKEKLSTK